MAKRGAKPKKVKGEMVWVPDYLVSSVKKLKEIDMIGLKERFAEPNIDTATVEHINNYGVKLLSHLEVYRAHILIPTSSPDQTLFGFRIVTVIDGEDLNVMGDLERTPPFKSLEDAIAAAKAIVDEFFEDIKDHIDDRSLHYLKFYSAEDQALILGRGVGERALAERDEHDS
jgi:hypothetical protein